MSTKSDTAAFWESIPGAKPLRETYGYWPTLHDAVIRSMRMGYEARELEIVLDYSDSNSNSSIKVEHKTRITFCWRAVSKSSPSSTSP